MFTSKKHIDRLHDSITELHTDKERLQRIVHKQSEAIHWMAVSVKQQEEIIREQANEIRLLKHNKSMSGFIIEVMKIDREIERMLSKKSAFVRDEKGRFKKRK